MKREISLPIPPALRKRIAHQREREYADSEAVKGVSLLGIGICSVPERMTEVVLSFTRPPIDKVLSSPFSLKRRTESSY